MTEHRRVTSRPDPKSFDTLEKAQAEIARCYAKMDRAAEQFKSIEATLEAMLKPVNERLAETAK